MFHVVILVHKYDQFSEFKYVLHEISRVWEQQGARVSVQRGPGPKIDADMCILHADLTVVPDEYMEFVRAYSVCLNHGVGNISKRAISENLVTHEDAYAGPVIVKSNLNCGGYPEDRLANSEWARRRLGKMQIWRRPRMKAVSGYRIFASASEVPANVWTNPNLVVERFLPEIRDGKYCLRTWLFLGDRETNSLSYSADPVVKSGNILHRETGVEVPEELRRMRRQLGFDFGKFDYAMVDGRVILYDANRTPTFGRFSKEMFSQSILVLSKGIESYISP